MNGTGKPISFSRKPGAEDFSSETAEGDCGGVCFIRKGSRGTFDEEEFTRLCAAFLVPLEAKNGRALAIAGWKARRAVRQIPRGTMKPWQNFRRFDVRELLRRGEEPLPQILQRVETLQPREGLMLVAPFLPGPLIQLLRHEGFASRSEQRGSAEWVVYFWRDQ